MTNAEKYLKDNVSVEEFANAYAEVEQEALNGIHACNIKHFLQQPIQPTLTEDERAILRNIMFFTKIGKDRTSIYVATKENSIYRLGVFNHLFQFINERRRIRDSRIIRR